MVERFTAHFRGLYVNAQVFLGFFLTDIVRHGFRTERILGLVLAELAGGDDTLIIRHAAGKFNTQRYTPLLDQAFIVQNQDLTSFFKH